MKQTGIVVLSLLTIVTFSCAQEKISITKNRWLTISALAEKPIDLNNTGTTSTDLLAQSPHCTVDDIFVFYENKKFLKDDNQNVCDEYSNQKGTWDLVNKDTLTITFNDGYTLKFKVVKLTPDQLVLMSNMDLIPGGVNVTYTFKGIQ